MRYSPVWRSCPCKLYYYSTVLDCVRLGSGHRPAGYSRQDCLWPLDSGSMALMSMRGVCACWLMMSPTVGKLCNTAHTAHARPPSAPPQRTLTSHRSTSQTEHSVVLTVILRRHHRAGVLFAQVERDPGHGGWVVVGFTWKPFRPVPREYWPPSRRIWMLYTLSRKRTMRV